MEGLSDIGDKILPEQDGDAIPRSGVTSVCQDGVAVSAGVGGHVTGAMPRDQADGGTMEVRSEVGRKYAREASFGWDVFGERGLHKAG